jgi:uncharacterized protein (UPF0548 family)
MWFLNKPSEAIVQAFRNDQSQRPFSYPEVGLSRQQMPVGYDVDHHRLLLGTGPAVFDAACAALRNWQMFPAAWMQVYPAATPIQPGEVVVVLAHVFGLWWLNACRIVYRIDEAKALRCFGFAYGTLPGHVECGEERFTVEWETNDSVWYDLRAFSRPRHWLLRLTYPLARRLQQRFAGDSQAAVCQAITSGRHTTGILR